MISIILAMFNEEETIENMINSILKQTYDEFQLILVDDGSKDATKIKCLNYVNKDKRIEYYYQENKGVASARNLGLSKIKGKYVTFLDADDVIEAEYLYILYKNIESSLDIDLAICSYTQNGKKHYLKSGILNQNESLNEIIERNGSKGYLWNKLFKKEIIVKNKMQFNPKFKVLSDIPFCVEYLTYSKTIKYSSKILIHYAINSNSISNNLRNPNILSQIYSLQHCIILLTSNNATEDLINKYITAYFRAITGLIFRMKFQMTKDYYVTLNDAINRYKFRHINGFLVKIKYVIGKLILHYKKITI